MTTINIDAETPALIPAHTNTTTNTSSNFGEDLKPVSINTASYPNTSTPISTLTTDLRAIKYSLKRQYKQTKPKHNKN